MTDEDRLLYAFMANPADGAAARAYVDWLAARGDARAAYLRRVAGLDDPVAARRTWWDVSDGVPAEWRAMIDSTRVATTGVYRSGPIDGAWDYLRFFPHKLVRAVCSTAGPPEAWQRLDDGNRERAVREGTYDFSMSGEELRFTLVQEPPAWMERAWRAEYDRRLDEDIARDFDFIAADAAIREHAAKLKREFKSEFFSGTPHRETITLRWRRPMDGSEGVLTYWLVKGE